MESPGIRSARRMRRRIPCSSGAVWRRSTIRRGTSFSAVRPIRRRPWSSARKGVARRPCGFRPTPSSNRTIRPIPTERVFVISYDDFNPYLDNCKAAIRAPNMDAGPGDLAASRPHGRHPVARRDQAGRSADVGEGRSHRAQPRPAPRPVAPGRALRRLDRASRSRAAGAGSAADPAFARSGPAATCRSASARPWWSSR